MEVKPTTLQAALAAMVHHTGKASNAKPAARPKSATPVSLAVPSAVIWAAGPRVEQPRRDGAPRADGGWEGGGAARGEECIPRARGAGARLQLRVAEGGAELESIVAECVLQARIHLRPPAPGLSARAVSWAPGLAGRPRGGPRAGLQEQRRDGLAPPPQRLNAARSAGGGRRREAPQAGRRGRHGWRIGLPWAPRLRLGQRR